MAKKFKEYKPYEKYNSLEDQNEGLTFDDAADREFVYHATTDQETLDKILKEGLRVDSYGFIYLSAKPIKVLGPYFIKVRIPDHSFLADWREYWYTDHDDKQYDPENPYYIYLKHIPPEYLEDVTGKVDALQEHSRYEDFFRSLLNRGRIV